VRSERPEVQLPGWDGQDGVKVRKVRGGCADEVSSVRGGGCRRQGRQSSGVAQPSKRGLPASKEGRPSVLGKRSVFDLAELPLAGKRWSAAARAQLNRTRFHDEFAVEARPGSHSVLDHTAE
jgi:hypothetical protein